MSETREHKERLRRWGWVSVAFGLPGAALVAMAGYWSFVEGYPIQYDGLFIGLALAAPLFVGIRMIASGYRPDDTNRVDAGDDASNVGSGTPKAKTRSPGLSPAFLLAVAVSLTGFGVMAIPTCGCSTRAKAYEAAMKSDLKNLASQEEIYFSDHYAYSSSSADLAFVNSDGVQIHLVATASGWTANAWHLAFGEGVGCASYYGDVDFVLRMGGGRAPRDPGQIVCDDF